MNRRNTKRALCMSFVSLLLCCSMLVGSTFAWFTDTATTNVNSIQSGTLDVDLVDAAGKTLVGETLEFKKAAGAPENEAVLWEPGCTYELPEVFVKNNGNLHLKYQIVITGINGDAELNDVIEWTIQLADAELADVYSLAPGATSGALTISGHMKEDAGNEYQGLTIDGIAITVVATQKDAEYDSFDNEYDADAQYKYDGSMDDYVETEKDENDPEKIVSITIKDATGLMAFAEKFGTEETKYITTVVIDRDIDLTGYNWKPINAWDSENSVVLTIVGRGHTISNMTAEGGSKLGFIGANSRDITIKDLTFDNANVTTSGSFAGVVIGYQYGDVVLDNVDVKNSTVMSTAEKGIRLGGLVGMSCLSDGATLNVTNCDVSALEVSGYHNVAGLVGTLQNYDDLTSKWTLTANTVTNSTFTVTSGNEEYGAAFAVEGANYPHTYTESTAYFTGNAESGNTFVFPIYISTAEQLAAIGDSANALYYLTNDIDLAGVEWNSKNLAGTFDGQGHTISNLNKNLFGTVSGAVKNLNVKNVNILNTTKNGANGFIGTVAAGGLVENCKVSGVDIKWTAEVNAKDTTDGFGGVIGGVQAGATVQNCEFSDITVTSNGKTKRTGGVFSSITGTVKDCVFTNVNFTVADTDTLEGWVTSHGGGLACDVNGGAVVEDCVINNMQVNVYEAAGQLGGVFGKAHISGQTAPITLKGITVNGLTMNVGNASESMKNVAGFIGQPDSRKNDVRVAIDNCHINGLDMTLVSSKQGESAAAGFISGLCGGVDVTNCSVSGKINGTNTPANIGGFIGDAGGYGSIEQNFTNCFTNVDITVKDSIAGGFVAVDGTLKNGSAILNFTECKANGTVTVVDGGTGTAAEFCGKTIE